MINKIDIEKNISYFMDKNIKIFKALYSLLEGNHYNY